MSFNTACISVVAHTVNDDGRALGRGVLITIRRYCYNLPKYEPSTTSCPFFGLLAYSISDKAAINHKTFTVAENGLTAPTSRNGRDIRTAAACIYILYTLRSRMVTKRQEHSFETLDLSYRQRYNHHKRLHLFLLCRAQYTHAIEPQGTVVF